MCRCRPSSTPPRGMPILSIDFRRRVGNGITSYGFSACACLHRRERGTDALAAVAKVQQWVTHLAMLGILSADMGTALYCYLTNNLTLLAKIDTVLFAALCFAVKSLFTDTFMQWRFSYITIQNVSNMVIIPSFVFSRNLPYPAYANVAVRLVLLSLFYWLLRFKVRTLCRQMVEHCNCFWSGCCWSGIPVWRMTAS